MATLYIMITAVLALSGVVMWALTAFYRSPSGQPHHIRDGKSRPISDEQFRRYARINSPLSIVLVYGYTLALQHVVFRPDFSGIVRTLLEGLGILLVYELGYYLLHRFPFHEWRLLRSVHAVHHTIKNPNANDSLYQHPLENFLGLTLFWGSALAVALVAGRISIYAFGWAFCLYSLVNVVIHSGLTFSRFPLNLLNYLGVRHYKHHASMRAKNYGSVTPIFDLIFGTEEA